MKFAISLVLKMLERTESFRILDEILNDDQRIRELMT